MNTQTSPTNNCSDAKLFSKHSPKLCKIKNAKIIMKEKMKSFKKISKLPKPNNK
jgi:hypothetical protein